MKALGQADASLAALDHLDAIGAALACAAGHDWRFSGVVPCGCPRGGCEFPVHTCARCGDSDRGQNVQAAGIRAVCDALNPE